MNDEIQVANPELLAACFAAIIELFNKNGVKYEVHTTAYPWKVIVYGHQNPDILVLSERTPSWTFSQTKGDPHMQDAYVSVGSFVRNALPVLRAAKIAFDAEYDRLKEKYGDEFTAFLERASERNTEESYESSSWSASSLCW